MKHHHPKAKAIAISKKQQSPIWLYFALALSALVIFMSSAKAQSYEFSDEKLLYVEGLASSPTLQPGETIWIGVKQIIRPHWHTYWKNPGDSGSPPEIMWDLPEGFEVSEIYYPTPKKLPYGPLLNYGYDGEAILLQKLTAPKNLPDGKITLKADTAILVCQDECVPSFGKVEITFNGAQQNAAQTEEIDNALKALPQEIDWSATSTEKDGFFILSLNANELPDDLAGDITDAALYPDEWGIIESAEPTSVTKENNHIIISQKRGDRKLSDVKTISGVITLKTTNGAQHSYALKNTTPAEASAHSSAGNIAPQNITFPGALLLAFLGGLILNLMPCVFPVLSIKALSLVKIAEKDKSLARLHGIAYTAGILVMFITIASILIGLKAAGSGIGWGFQLQNVLVVSVLSILLYIVGLNLAGYFEISAGSLGNVGQKYANNAGAWGSFFTGILATIVATPCTAPFMGVALGYALTQPLFLALLIFVFLGIGLAFPYILISFIPALQVILPRPGAWMVRFKELLAYPMFLSSLYLLWVIDQQVGTYGTFSLLAAMTTLGLFFWTIKLAPRGGLGKAIRLVFLAYLFLVATTLTYFPFTLPAAGHSTNAHANDISEAFTPETLETALASEQPVFVEMTAAWCITCKVNNLVAINVPSTHKLFEESNIRYIVGDWTNYNEDITKYLNHYGRDGVPLYVYYPKPDENNMRPEPIILPQILTTGIIDQYISGV